MLTEADSARRRPVLVWDPVMTSPYYSAGLVAALRRQGFTAQLVGAMPTHDPDVAERFGIGRSTLICRLAARVPVDPVRKALRLADALLAPLVPLSAGLWQRATIHIQWMPGADRGLAWLWAICLRVLGWRCQLVHTEHNRVPHERRNPTRVLRAKRQTYHLFDHILVQSRESREEIAPQVGPRTTVTWVQQPIIDLGRPTPTAPTEFDIDDVASIEDGRLRLIGHVGGSRGHKQFEDLIALGAELDSADVRVVVAGSGVPADGRDGGSVIAIPRRLSAGEVEWLLEHLSIAVFPYRSITASGALTASVGRGHAVITSDIEDLSRLIPDEIVQRYQVGDVERLGALVRTLLGDTDLMDRQRAAVRQYATRSYSFDDLIRDSIVGYR